MGRPATSEDVACGLRITSLFTANAVAVSGLFYVLGGGWSHCLLPVVPSPVLVHIVVVVDLGTTAPGTLLRLKIVVLNPQAQPAHSQEQDVAAYASGDLTPRVSFTNQLPLNISEPGIWTIQVSSGDILLARYPLEFRGATPAE
jgi:hypothetical protein